MARVSIARTETDYYAAFSWEINDIGGQIITPGDHTLIKPTLAEPAVPDSGQITNPEVIEAVARYCLDGGAAPVITGEGPGYYPPFVFMRWQMVSKNYFLARFSFLII